MCTKNSHAPYQWGWWRDVKLEHRRTIGATTGHAPTPIGTQSKITLAALYTRQLETIDALVQFLSNICHYLDDKNVLLVQSIRLDFSRAFDRMRPDLTVSKLIGT